MNKSIQVLFVSINNTWRYGNMGFDQLLGYLRNKGFNIKIAYYRNKTTAEEIYNDIRLKGMFDVYAFSVNSSIYEKCIDISEKIKVGVKSAKIVFGGGYPTRYYREILSRDGEIIDYVIIGDGEAPTEYLFDKLEKNIFWGDELIVNHSSIALLNDVENKKEYFNTIIDWYPAFDYYEKDDIHTNSRKVHCIQIKNNICTGNCSFCTERHGKVIYKKITDIVEQIKYVHNTFGVKKFFFTDDNILDPNNERAKQHLKDLCDSIRKCNLNVAFQCYIKALSLGDIENDHKLLDIMYEVGFREIFVGIEAGNQDDLDLYNKYTTVKQNRDIIRLIEQHGIFPIIGYIAYNPYSSRKTIRDNFLYLCDIECTYLHNYLYSFVVINKYTSLYDSIKKDGLLVSDDDEYLDVKYDYKNKDIIEVLNYVKNEMLPVLRTINYELDWVIYSMMEHEIWYKNINDYKSILLKQKKIDAKWIRDKLSFLFIEFNVDEFRKVEQEFWNHFRNEEVLLKEIYNYYISLHY